MKNTQTSEPEKYIVRIADNGEPLVYELVRFKTKKKPTSGQADVDQGSFDFPNPQ